MLADYLQRIGVEPPVEVSAEGLARLHRAHLYSVPFENLDIHRGVPIVLDEAALLDKIVRRRRGGFCYELNGAFAWLLRQLGFEVHMLAANVHGDGGWGIDFDHMLLHVAMAEPWLADVGFGDSFVEPLRWSAGLEQPQAVGTFRLARSDDHWILERDGVAQYRFLAQPHALADFAPGCAYHQSPASHFTRGTICSQARPDGRITLRAGRLIDTTGGTRTERPIEDEAGWRAALGEHFGLS